MPGAIRAHVTAAGLAIDLGGDLAKDRRDHFPGLARATGHERRTFERAFFAAGNAAPDKMNPLPFQFLAASLSVGEQRATAVDSDIAFLKDGDELADDRIDGRAGLDHDHGFARPCEGADKLLHRGGGLDVFTFPTAGGELLRDRGGPIKDGDAEALRLHVEDQVFAHDGEADEANIALIRFHFGYLLNAVAALQRQTLKAWANRCQRGTHRSFSQPNLCRLCLTIGTERPALHSTSGGWSGRWRTSGR